MIIKGVPVWLFSLLRLFWKIEPYTPEVVDEGAAIRALREENAQLRRVAADAQASIAAYFEKKKTQDEVFFQERLYLSLPEFDSWAKGKQVFLNEATRVSLRVQVPATSFLNKDGYGKGPEWSATERQAGKAVTGEGANAWAEARDRMYRLGLARKKGGEWFALIHDDPLVWHVTAYKAAPMPQVRVLEVPVPVVPESEEEAQARVEAAAREAAERELEVELRNARVKGVRRPATPNAESVPPRSVAK